MSPRRAIAGLTALAMALLVGAAALLAQSGGGAGPYGHRATEVQAEAAALAPVQGRWAAHAPDQPDDPPAPAAQAAAVRPPGLPGATALAGAVPAVHAPCPPARGPPAAAS